MSLQTLKNVLMSIKHHDVDYDKRYVLVFEAVSLALKLGYAAGVRVDPACPDWPVIVIELPTGQVTWHMPSNKTPYDGHSTEEKFRRIDVFCDTTVISPLPSVTPVAPAVAAEATAFIASTLSEAAAKIVAQNSVTMTEAEPMAL